MKFPLRSTVQIGRYVASQKGNDRYPLVIMLEQDEHLVVAAGAGEMHGSVHGQRMPIDGTVTGRVLRIEVHKNAVEVEGD